MCTGMLHQTVQLSPRGLRRCCVSSSLELALQEALRALYMLQDTIDLWALAHGPCLSWPLSCILHMYKISDIDPRDLSLLMDLHRLGTHAVFALQNFWIIKPELMPDLSLKKQSCMVKKKDIHCLRCGSENNAHTVYTFNSLVLFRKMKCHKFLLSNYLNINSSAFLWPIISTQVRFRYVEKHCKNHCLRVVCLMPPPAPTFFFFMGALGGGSCNSTNLRVFLFLSSQARVREQMSTEHSNSDSKGHSYVKTCPNATSNYKELQKLLRRLLSFSSVIHACDICTTWDWQDW